MLHPRGVTVCRTPSSPIHGGGPDVNSRALDSKALSPSLANGWDWVESHDGEDMQF